MQIACRGTPSFAATPLLGPYAMSKHALEAYSDALRAEMAVLGVTVVAIEPGRFATNIVSTSTKRMEEQGRSLENSPYAELARRTMERYSSAQIKEGPERVARAIEEALSSPVPRPRNLVVSDQRDAEFAIRRELQKVAQLNQAHPFSHDRNTLVKMLDEALANPGGVGATMGKVTGTVSYRERIALPPAATIRVRLVDMSRADAPADVLGEQLIEAAGRQVPLAFEIPYDLARIDERMSYAVQARIEDGNRLLFISDESYPVITRAAPRTVNLLLKSVGHSPL
jgi:putative lipoprotein